MPRTPQFLLFSIAWLLVVAACRSIPVDTSPILSKTSQPVQAWALPPPLPTTENDLVLAFASPDLTMTRIPQNALRDNNTLVFRPNAGQRLIWGNMAICADNYDQIQVTMQFRNAPTPYDVDVGYTPSGQRITPAHTTTITVESDAQQTYAIDTKANVYFDGMIETIQLRPRGDSAANGRLHLIEVRLIRNALADQCAVAGIPAFTEADFVLDFTASALTFADISRVMQVREGLTFSPGGDPSILQQGLALCAEDYDYLVVTMQASEDIPARAAQIFYSPYEWRLRDERVVSIPLANDGEMHTYVLPTGTLYGWRGIIQQFRIDPVIRGNPNGQNTVHIQAIRLVRGSEPSHCARGATN